MITSELDVTPHSTISTYQFTNETLNVIVTSLLAVLIFSNLSSIITKVLFATHKNYFSYPTFLRAYLFLNSDDPARLLSWIFSRSYTYKLPTWHRHPHNLRLNRLVIPLFARSILIIASVASIAITIPSEKKLTGCDRGFYYPILTLTNKNLPPNQVTYGYYDIPITSTLGTVVTEARYISTLEAPSAINFSDFSETTIVLGHSSSTAELLNGVIVKGAYRGFISYIEWSRQSAHGRAVWRSTLPTYDWQQHEAIMLEAIRKAERRDCQRMKYEDVDEVFYITLDCVITDANKVALHAEALMRRNLKWKKNAQNVTGAKLLRRMNDKWKNSTICPVDIIVSRPIVNIVPLIAGLLLLFTVNVAVGLTVSERGDVLDAVFHLVKEVVGVDCTSNALEERQGGDVQPVIELKQWQCKGGRNIGHVGFLKGVGDYSVDGLDDVLVSSCNHAKTDGYSIGKWREKGVWKEFGITP